MTSTTPPSSPPLSSVKLSSESAHSSSQSSPKLPYRNIQQRPKTANIRGYKQGRQQAKNCQLIESWDNFKLRENVHGERVGDIVKFRSITMALWIQKGWRIPVDGLKQSMWSQRNDVLKARAMTRAPCLGKIFEARGINVSDIIGLLHLLRRFPIKLFCSLLVCRYN